jgi:hypothetical protein
VNGDRSQKEAMMNETKMPATEIVHTMFHAVDDLDWDRFRGCLADEVAIDYTSLWGGVPESIAAHDLMRSWQEVAAGYDATQHFTGPIVVTGGDERGIRCTTNVRAYHHVADEEGGASTWMVAGRYIVELVSERHGPKVSAIALNVLYEEGDRDLVDKARRRVASGEGGRSGLSTS